MTTQSNKIPRKEMSREERVKFFCSGIPSHFSPNEFENLSSSAEFDTWVLDVTKILNKNWIIEEVVRAFKSK